MSWCRGLHFLHTGAMVECYNAGMNDVKEEAPQ